MKSVRLRRVCMWIERKEEGGRGAWTKYWVCEVTRLEEDDCYEC